MPRLTFFDWQRPLLESLANHLLPSTGHGPLDLGHLLILTPTRQSGRRLREHLTRCWRARGGTAILSLQVSPPSVVMQPASEVRVAHLFDVLPAWCDTLTGVDPETLPNLLPGRTERLNPTAALDFGRNLQKIREELLDAGLDLHEVANRHPLASEQMRWREMARLEADYRARLERMGLVDPCDARRAAAAAFRPPAPVKTVVLAAVPDPSPIVLRRLRELDREIDIEVCVHAPASSASDFDEWGRPAPVWEKRSIGPAEEPPGWIELLADPPALGRRLQEIFPVEPATPDIGFGLLDEALEPIVRQSLEEAGKRLYHPKPVSLVDTPPARLIHLLHAQRSEGGLSPLRELWRHPDVLAALSSAPESLLAEWDRHASEHLPQETCALEATLDPGSRLGLAWKRLAEWIAADSPTALLSALRDIYRHRILDPANPQERFALRGFSAVSDLLREAARREAEGRPPSTAVLLETLREERIDPPRVEGDVVAEGWLELAYHPAPSLLLIGLHEGVVPASRTADPFLPDSLRAELGLRSDRDWHARDAFLLHAMTQCRPGSVRILVVKRDAEGNPLRPSRLLFACPDEILLKRAVLLFREPAPPPPPPAPSPGLVLRVDRAKERPINRLSVSAIRDYIGCPARFYLRHVLKMESVDDLAREPDAAAFGSLLHAVLRRLVSEGPCEAAAWDRKAADILDSVLTARYGPHLTMSLRVVRESALRRLQAAGATQRTLEAEGWRSLFLELPVERECDGLSIHGTIDRVDVHPTRGLRIIDYKTADTPVVPEKAHLGPAQEGAEAWWVTVDGKRKQWIDLQLPLYRWLAGAIPEIDPALPMEVLYIQLPKDTRLTGLAGWPEERELAPQAESALREVVRRVKARIWTPATTKVEFDDFAPLFHHGGDWLQRPP